ncbi:c-type cytochrome [Steroidobacter cummioxidans]|uniref:c-type cytochrome n=1 Tax=Steroidobacter cummioxidans TaxID=1803913 RepID=UPI000E31E56F|nr:cytochrome c [Steroidobacter cummioxidans]
MNSSQVRHRERPEPHEADAGIPGYIFGLIAALVLWGAYYLWTAPMQRDLRIPAAATTVDGGQLFAANCAACHQPTGLGLTGVFPPLAGAEWVTGDPRVLAQILLHGINGTLAVKGTLYSGAMPAFGTQFDDAQLAAIASYIRSNWGNNAEPVHASLIASERERFATRQAPWNGQNELESTIMDGS